MLVAWEEIAMAFGMKESNLESYDRWAKLTQLSRTRARDALIAFPYTFLSEHEKRLVDADVFKRIDAETGSRRTAVDTPRERVNLANKGDDVGQNKQHHRGHLRRWNTEREQEVKDIASIPLTASCFNGMEVDVDKDRTSDSPLPKCISTEGTLSPISYEVPRSDIVPGPECPTRSSKPQQPSNRVTKLPTTHRPSTKLVEPNRTSSTEN
ncbi:hypothetical protein PGQ11_002806 [Apiospora arundinis]|uniref:Uncharacterized protein n=1 Tax=Apiospora arundinis TaxID=335852 RepID=A0ABR2J349_9PEZI